MIEIYIKDDSPAGDLARDIKNDHTFPKRSISHKEIKEHLIYKNACEECLATFEECWKEYVIWRGGELD